MTNGVLTGTKSPVADGGIANFAIVAARTASTGRETDIGLFIVDLSADGVETKTLQNVDPSRNQAEISLHQRQGRAARRRQ